MIVVGTHVQQCNIFIVKSQRMRSLCFLGQERIPMVNFIKNQVISSNHSGGTAQESDDGVLLAKKELFYFGDIQVKLLP